MPAHVQIAAPPPEPPRAPRRDGWTAARQRLFFDALAAGHSVVWACARVGLSRRAAYSARRRDAEFAHRWQAAQQSARRAAEQAFLEGLPENLRDVVSGPSTGCELRGGSIRLSGRCQMRQPGVNFAPRERPAERPPERPR